MTAKCADLDIPRSYLNKHNQYKAFEQITTTFNCKQEETKK